MVTEVGGPTFARSTAERAPWPLFLQPEEYDVISEALKKLLVFKNLDNDTRYKIVEYM